MPQQDQTGWKLGFCCFGLLCVARLLHLWQGLGHISRLPRAAFNSLLLFPTSMLVDLVDGQLRPNEATWLHYVKRKLCSQGALVPPERSNGILTVSLKEVEDVTSTLVWLISVSLLAHQQRGLNNTGGTKPVGFPASPVLPVPTWLCPSERSWADRSWKALVWTESFSVALEFTWLSEDEVSVQRFSKSRTVASWVSYVNSETAVAYVTVAVMLSDIIPPSHKRYLKKLYQIYPQLVTEYHIF